MTLQMQLSSLVREADDPWLVLYVINNLGAGVPPQSPYSQAFEKYRAEMRGTLLRMLWRPQESRMESLKLRVTKRLPGPSRGNLAVSNKVLLQRRALAGQAAQAIFAVKIGREYGDMTNLLDKDGPQVIAVKLRDTQPLTRWVAAQIAGRKRLYLTSQLIDLLTDPSPVVRQAARAALVRLSRGNDFGPLPKANPNQIAHSVRAWRYWLSLQDPPEPLPELLPAPLLAEDQAPPPRRAELLPPQLAEIADAGP